MGVPAESGLIKRKRGAINQEWKGFLWEKVPAATVAGFFEGYQTHPKARKVISSLVADFVKVMAKSSELTDWTVVVVGGGEGASYALPGGLLVDTLKRSADADITDRYSIGRLLSQRDEAIDLDEKGWEAALQATMRAWKPDAGRQHDGAEPKQPELPNGPAIRRVRGRGAEGVAPALERGLLLLYLLDPAHARSAFPTRKEPIVAFGASFPTSDAGVKVEYKVDHLLWELEYDQGD
jgi:hypothetical protein